MPVEEASSGSAQRRRSRPWTVRVAGLLLLVQAVAYVLLSPFLLLPFDRRASLDQGALVESWPQTGALAASGETGTATGFPSGPGTFPG